MLAVREAGVIPTGVKTGIFSAEALKAAGACQVLSDLKGADAIFHLLLSVSR